MCSESEVKRNAGKEAWPCVKSRMQGAEAEQVKGEIVAEALLRTGSSVGGRKWR